MLNLAAGFANTARLVEKEIVNLGFSHDDGDTRRGWMAYKAVSHFNFHQSFEILIKLILRLERQGGRRAWAGAKHGVAKRRSISWC